MARIGHLVFVAGAQAAGKTTFIDHWQTGRLSAELAAALPPVAGWPVFHVKTLRRFTAKRRRQAGVIVQYDMMRRLLVSAYDQDPAIVAAAMAKTVTVVFVNAPAGLLARRLATRHVRRAAGLGDTEPPPPFGPRVWFLNALARTRGGKGGLLRKMPLVRGALTRFRSGFGDWHWHALQTYLHRPGSLPALREELLAALATRSRDTITVHEVSPAFHRRRKIAWVPIGGPRRMTAGAPGAEPRPFPSAGALPTSGT